MTETDELRHALQLVHNAIEGDTSGLKEAWNLISSHIDILEHPSPVSLDTHTAEEILRKVGTFHTIEARHMASGIDTKFITPESALIAMTEYASQESLKARQEAIQECIEVTERELENTDDHAAYVACLNVVGELKEKLKSDSTKPPYEK